MEIENLHKIDMIQRKMRKCSSYKEIREYQDERDPMQELLLQSSEDEEFERQFNFISEPNSPRSKEMLLNPAFHYRMSELSKAYCMRD